MSTPSTPRTQAKGLQVATVLHQFIEEKVLPGTGVTSDAFWSGFDAIVADLAPIPVLNREVAWALYRFVQQALGNIEHHAKAGAVKLTLHSSQGIHLQVYDDGVGFSVLETIQRRSGLGLTSMRERIEMLGGEFEIHSRPGMTVLKAYLPSESLRID